MSSEEIYGPEKRVDIENVLPWRYEENTGSLHSHDAHGGDFVTVNERQDLRIALHQRHISLIALAGAIVR
jgi:amino acid permease